MSTKNTKLIRDGLGDVVPQILNEDGKTYSVLANGDVTGINFGEHKLLRDVLGSPLPYQYFDVGQNKFVEGAIDNGTASSARITSGGSVTSVNNKIGDVVLTAADVGAIRKTDLDYHANYIASTTVRAHVAIGEGIILESDGRIRTNVMYWDSLVTWDLKDFILGVTFSLFTGAVNTTPLNNVVRTAFGGISGQEYLSYRGYTYNKDNLNGIQEIDVYHSERKLLTLHRTTSNGVWSNSWKINFHIFANSGNPEGVMTATQGTMCCDLKTGQLYEKTTARDVFTNTGWEAIG